MKEHFITIQLTGEQGAGKSSLMQMLADIIEPTEEYIVDAHDDINHRMIVKRIEK